MSEMTIPVPKSFSGWGKARGLFVLMILAGVATFVYGMGIDSHRIWVNFLLNYFYWLSIALAGVFFAALQHLTGSYWSTTVRRIGEVFIAYLPVSLLLGIVLYFGLGDLLVWFHPDQVANDPLLQSKSAYLNPSFFIFRHFALYVLVLVMGGWMVKNSLRQDQNGNPKLTLLNVKISAPFMFFFGWLFTFASFDLIMSLTPHWFSTIFGVYCWAGLFYSGLAMITLWVVLIKKEGPLAPFVTADHLHDLGKLMFAFMVFWAYIGFSQFVLIWYANQPEEVVYYLDRMHGWSGVSIALALGKFVIPFFLLLSRPAKRNENFLIFMSFWFLAAQWLDLYWMIFPKFYPEAPVFGWMEVGLFAGFAGLFFLTVGSYLSRVSVVAIRDPRIEEALHHHQ